MIASNIWEDILSRVQAKVNRHSFYTWFKPTSFIGDDGRIIDAGDARLQSAYRDVLDSLPEGGFVARLAGFVIGLRKRLGGGRSDLSYGDGKCQ